MPPTGAYTRVRRLDWYWGRSLAGALTFIDEQRPDVVIFQWWTGAVLHTYLRWPLRGARGVRVILEWHEGQDVGEATLPALATTSAPFAALAV